MEIWTAPFEGVRDPGAPGPRLGKAEPFLRTPLSEGQPTYSPDGLWLAYSSNETGTDEVYVRPVPGHGGRTPISTGGGRFPVWSRNGRKLFFVGPDERIMVVGYAAKRDSFAVGKPQVWSPKSLLVLFGVPSYDLAPDGKRFAVVLYPGGQRSKSQSPCAA